MSAKELANKEQIFAEAAEMSDARERNQYLDRACAGDRQLRTEIEQLLRHDLDVGSFLEKPAAAFVATQVFSDSSGDTVKEFSWTLDFLAPSDNPDCMGTIGAYEVTEVIGRGGMGVVLKGFDPKLNRVVAIKVLAPELASHASARKRFLREGQAAAAISHDHVVTIHAIDDSGTLPFIVMEYVSDQSLQQRIDGSGALELTEILRIGKQAAAGLAAAHAEGLIHRDIKPGNLLLEKEGQRVKITDFGLARAVDDVRLTKPGTVTGTPEYMSPEQARGDRVDHRSDLFSLGCVLYAMCTGKAPFHAENTVAMIRRVCEDEPRSIREINPDIPIWLVKLVEKLLAKDPDQRFQSASEVEDLLDQYLAHVQEPAIHTSPPDFKPLPPKPKPKAVARRRIWGTATVLLLLVGLAAFAPTIIRIARGDGTLVIEVDDPNVEVLIDGEEIVFKGAGAKDIRIRPGEHEVVANKDGKRVHHEIVTIARRGRQVVKITLEPPARESETAKDGTGAAVKVASGLICTYPWPGGEPEHMPAISSDGTWLVFVDVDSHSLVRRDLKTGEDRRLAEINLPVIMHGFGRFVTISADGQQVAYNSYDDKNQSVELRTVAIEGGQPRVIFDPDENVRWISPWNWTPDGKQIVGRLARTDETAAIVTVTVADGSVHELKALGYWDALSMSLSPDGRYIAYSHLVDNSFPTDISLLPIDGGPAIPVVEHPGNDGPLDWTADGRLLFWSNRGGSYDAWLIPIVDGKAQGPPQLVKREIGWVGQVTRGGSLYYRVDRQQSKLQHVYVADVDPDTYELLTPPKQVSSRTDQRTLSPDFSADGRYLAYYVAPPPVRSDGQRRYPPGNIVVRSLKTGQERQITLAPELSDDGFWPRLRWHPDGRSALMSGRTETGQSLFQVDMQTGKLTPFGRHPLSDQEGYVTSWGEYSPDGKAVFYSLVHFNPDAPRGQWHSGWRAMRRNLETGQDMEVCRKPVGDDDSRAFIPSPDTRSLYVSPDGRHLLIGGHNALWILPTTGGAPQELLRLDEFHDFLRTKTGFSNRIRWDVTWTPDSRSLLFLKGGQRGCELWRIAAEGGDPEFVDALPIKFGSISRAENSVHELRLRPDGRQIAFVMYRPPELELWAQENVLPKLSAPLTQLPNPADGNYFVSQSADDAEESIGSERDASGDGAVSLRNVDLNLGRRSPPRREVEHRPHIGMRFQDIRIPKGAKIEKAFVQFTKYSSAAEAEPSDLTIRAELTGNAEVFTDAKRNISSRKLTKASVTWRPQAWDGAVGNRTEKQRTPDLSPLIQEVVSQKDWKEGNALVLMITGSGERNAYGFDGGGKRYAPMLHVESDRSPSPGDR